MKVTLKKNARRLEFLFCTDELDAIPVVDTLWFEFDRAYEIDTYRLTLLGYVSCAELIGNTFELEGMDIPAHLASVLQQTFLGHELFIEGANNGSKRILREPAFDALTCADCPTDPPPSTAFRSKSASMLYARRSALGYSFHNQSGELQLSVRTNLMLFSAMCNVDSTSASALMLYLIAYDTLRPAALCLAVTDPTRRAIFRRWLKEVGGKLV